ncbi:MAG: NAD(P)H-binding protein [Planctomycetota bacterium]|nr:NAD(P)H-binding protein [Planctomycetota bacterium]
MSEGSAAPARAIHVVTGAFGYSGRYITQRLLDAGHDVRTLTNSPERANPFGGRVRAFPYNFTAPDKLAGSLRGASVLYNTYWVRFNYRGFTQAEAVENTLKLFSAAKTAGVQRVVHISIANPMEDSPLEYYRGKARLEKALLQSGLSYAILRPTVLFGGEDILINNIAWMLRHLPVVGIFGDGQYKIQPIHVEDLARLAVEQGARTENAVVDAAGPEVFTYRGLVEEIGRIIGKRPLLVSVPPWVGRVAAAVMGKLLGDVIVTREEIKGLMAGLLATTSAPTGTTKLTDWAKEHAATLGVRYASELARRKNRRVAYQQL